MSGSPGPDVDPLQVVLSVFARTGRLPAPDPQPPVRDELRQFTEAYHRFGRRAGYAAAG